MDCLGKIGTCGIVKESVSLGAGLRLQMIYAIVPFMPPACGLGCELSAVPAAMLLLDHCGL